MDPEDIYNAVLGALADHAKAQEENVPQVGTPIPIEPFDADTFDEERVRVVGLVANPGNDGIDFIVLKTLEDGEMIPTVEGSIWPVKPPTAAA